MKNEEWRPCVGFPNYAVSSLGRVKRVTDGAGKGWRGQAGRILRPWTSGGGYPRVNLLRDGKLHKCLVHRLTARRSWTLKTKIRSIIAIIIGATISLSASRLQHRIVGTPGDSRTQVLLSKACLGARKRRNGTRVSGLTAAQNLSADSRRSTLRLVLTTQPPIERGVNSPS
jgi:hypothetical protein